MPTWGAGREAVLGAQAHRYERHCPEQTLLYQLVEEHYPAFVAELAAQGREVPGYVAREFEEYLKCGRLEHGFLRVRCEVCHQERLVAFSCKRRAYAEFDRLPFSQRLVVFDATDPAQIGTARRLGASAGGRRVTYLATRLDRSRGWQGLEALEDTLDAPVYVLTPEERARFALERVPAYVEAVGRAFRVTEVPPGTGP